MKLDKLLDENSSIWGNIIYDIYIDEISNDNPIVLNGLWTNNVSESRIMNEIARQKSKSNKDDLLPGEYECAFNEFKNNEIITIATKLIITKNSNHSYELIWGDGNEINFSGVGFRIDKKLVITYWDAN